MEHLGLTPKGQSRTRGNHRSDVITRTRSPSSLGHGESGACVLDFQILQRRFLMKFSGDVILIDGPTCAADISSLIADWVQQQFGSLEASMPRGYAMEKRPTINWIWQVRTGPDRPRDSVLGDKRFGLFRHWWRSIRTWFFRTKRLRQGEERCMCAHDGRRLPAPQTIKRNCRKAHEARTTDGDSGGDDD